MEFEPFPQGNKVERVGLMELDWGEVDPEFLGSGWL